MPDQFCTTAQVKARLQTSAGGVTWTASDDTLLGELIDEATSFIQAYVGRRILPEAAATYVFDTRSGYVLARAGRSSGDRRAEIRRRPTREPAASFGWPP